MKPRVLYSYPLRLTKKGGVAVVVYHHLSGLAKQGVKIDLYSASCDMDLDPKITIKTTMTPLGLRIPLRLLGQKAYVLHDYIVSRHLMRYHSDYDIVHCWPLGGLQTLTVAKKYGLKTFLERPNSHTEYAFEVVKKECSQLHYRLPKKHSHNFNVSKLIREKKEYEIADKLLCPSQFVYESFIRKGFARSKLALYHLGFDPAICGPSTTTATQTRPFRAIFAASCEPRKGLHYALRAWLKSKASTSGELLICGDFVKGYREILKNDLSHKSIKEVGYVDNLQSVFAASDVMLLPTVEEGSALVNYMARACGCVILVSDAAGAWGTHEHDLMVHRAGDVEMLTRHIDLCYQNREFMETIKANSLKTIMSYTWDKMAEKLLALYTESLSVSPHATYPSV